MACDAWPITWPIDTSGIEPEVMAAAAGAAQGLLWAMTGRRYGLCTVTERYRPACAGECGLPKPELVGTDVWTNRTGVGAVCCRLPLVNYPVRRIVSVSDSGETLSPGQYRIGRGSSIERIGTCWRCTDDCTEPPIVVTYRYGHDLPSIATLAMGEVAVEYTALFTGKTCKLPSRARTVTRNGVTVDMGDPEVLQRMHRLGLPIADSLIAATNPNGLQAPSRVYSPDLPSPA